MNFLYKIFKIPMIPLYIILCIYLTIKIYNETSEVDIHLLNESGGSLLTEEIKKHLEEQYQKYKVLDNAVCMCLWYLIIIL